MEKIREQEQRIAEEKRIQDEKRREEELRRENAQQAGAELCQAQRCLVGCEIRFEQD